jgi:hypothetical protein
VELWARNGREILPKVATSTSLLGSFTFRKARYGTDGFTSPPKDGVLRIFSGIILNYININGYSFRSETAKQKWDPSCRLSHLDVEGKEKPPHYDLKAATKVL